MIQKNKHSLKTQIDELEEKYSSLTFAIDRGFVSDTTEMSKVKIELDKAKKEYEKFLTASEWIDFRLDNQTLNEKKISVKNFIETCKYKISIISEYGDPIRDSADLKKEKDKLKLLEAIRAEL